VSGEGERRVNPTHSYDIQYNLDRYIQFHIDYNQLEFKRYIYLRSGKRLRWGGIVRIQPNIIQYSLEKTYNSIYSIIMFLFNNICTCASESDSDGVKVPLTVERANASI